MTVKRVVANFATDQMDVAKSFYVSLLGMSVGMDKGWIMTLVGAGQANPQVSFASEGGSGTPVPDLSIEVDDFQDVLQRARNSGVPIDYGPVVEPWSVERFFVRDPFGRLINILHHVHE